MKLWFKLLWLFTKFLCSRKMYRVFWAARKAVLKAENDPGLVKNAQKRADALEWTNHYLRDRYGFIGTDKEVAVAVELVCNL